MRVEYKAVFVSAAVGFTLSLLLLVFFVVSNGNSGNVLVQVCPFCVGSMTIDDAPAWLAVLGWLLFFSLNALLYAVPETLIAVAVSFRRRQ